MTDYPSARDALYELIDQETFAGETVTAYFRLQPEFIDSLPAVSIYPLGGTENWIDRTDRVGVDVYAVGTDSLDVAEAIRSFLSNQSHTTEAGYLDDVQVENVPTDVPYADPSINLTQAVYRVTTRPLVTF